MIRSRLDIALEEVLVGMSLLLSLYVFAVHSDCSRKKILADFARKKQEWSLSAPGGALPTWTQNQANSVRLPAGFSSRQRRLVEPWNLEPDCLPGLAGHDAPR